MWSNPALILALASKAFDKAGVKVTERQFRNPANIITAIASKDIDAGAAPGPTVFTAVQRGVKVKAVALLQGRNHPPISYMVRADSGIKTINDLRGKKAGVNNYGGNYDIYLRYWLTKKGINSKTDLEVVIVPVPSLLPSLINRQVDLVPLAAFARSIADRRYPGQTKEIFSYDDVIKDGVGHTNNNGLLLVFSGAYIAKSRGAAVNFLEAYLRTIRVMNQDSKKALKDWSIAVKNKALMNLAAPPSVPNNGEIYLDSLQFDADQAFRFGYLKKPVDAKTVVDNSLIREAAARLK